MITINITKDWSSTPGGRFRTEGQWSAEEFRDDVLRPNWKEAKKTGEILLINFDGGYGYPTSWLEEVFGGFIRKYNTPSFMNNVAIRYTEDDGTLFQSITNIVNDVLKQSYPKIRYKPRQSICDFYLVSEEIHQKTQ